MFNVYGKAQVFDSVEWVDKNAFRLHLHSFDDPQQRGYFRLRWEGGRVTIKEPIQEGDWVEIGVALTRGGCEKLAIKYLGLLRPGEAPPPPPPPSPSAPAPAYIIQRGYRYTYPDWDEDDVTFRITVEARSQQVGPFVFQWDGQAVRLLVQGRADDARPIGPAASREAANQAAAHFLLDVYETGKASFDPLTGEPS